jgi:hypothetical protein
MILPARAVELFGRIEDRDSPVFVTVAAFVMAFAGAERLCRIGDAGDRLKQSRLVALDLYDQSDAGVFGDSEVFSWQWSASSVTSVPAGTPSSGSSVWAARISLDFSETPSAPMLAWTKSLSAPLRRTVKVACRVRTRSSSNRTHITKNEYGKSPGSA